MAKYFLSKKAVEDISKIWNYTYEFWLEHQADKYYDLIIQTCQEVADKPKIGKKYEEISDDILGFLIGKHIIFYREINLGEIEIVRILHGSMDMKNRIDE